MVFKQTPLQGAYIIETEPSFDERGFFARTFCDDEFRRNGLKLHIVQSSVSYNKTKGTVRGMHYQEAPYGETKLVQCLRGSLYDVIIDIRPGSATFRKWFAIELSESDNMLIYIPDGFAHGFQTLADDTVLSYHISEFYRPDFARVIRWDDPSVGIFWPLPCSSISAKDNGV